MEELDSKILSFLEMVTIEEKESYTCECIFSLIQTKSLCENCIWKVNINV